MLTKGSFLIIAIILSILILILIILFRSRHLRKRLGRLVMERTSELELQSSTLTALFNAVPDSIYYKDLNSRYLHCNKGAEKLFGMTEKDIIGKSDREIFSISEDLFEKYITADRKVIE